MFFSIGYSYLATTIGLNGNVTVKGVGLMMPRYERNGEERAFWQYYDKIEHITGFSKTNNKIQTLIKER